MGTLCHQPFGLGRQLSGSFVRFLDLGSTKSQSVSRIAKGDTERAFVAFLASLGWRPNAAPTLCLDTLLEPKGSQGLQGAGLTIGGLELADDIADFA